MTREERDAWRRNGEEELRHKVVDGTNKQERVCDRRLPQKDAAASQAAISGGGPPENEKGRRPAHWPAGLERGTVGEGGK